jgi:YidC/Oxa1 family membrane protein insertase
VFEKSKPNLVPYYASQQKTISLMLRLDAKVLITTVPDLQAFHIKRSIVNSNIEYIHTFHGPTSTHLVYKEKAFDYFDTLFCVGPHQVSEIRCREKIFKLPRKNLVKAGYGLYDQLIRLYEKYSDIQRENDKPHILIAPSWHADNILDLCIDSILRALNGRGFKIIVRPHPQYIQMFPERIESLVKRYSEYAQDDSIVFELDFFNNESIFMSDVLITDWSGIAYEFSYCTLKPCIFINTPMKVMNPNYLKYGVEPLDILLRDKCGVSVNIDNINKLYNTVKYVLDNRDTYKFEIEEIVAQYLYYPRRNGEAAGKYIIKKLESQQIK